MGNSITQAIKEQQEKNDQEVTETLQMMHKMMENKIAATSTKVRRIVDMDNIDHSSTEHDTERKCHRQK